MANTNFLPININPNTPDLPPKIPDHKSPASQYLCFIQRFLKNPESVGSVVPSSSALAKKIVHFIPLKQTSQRPHYYLEVGPGTGAFTKEIVARLKPRDHFDVVELDEEFCSILKEKYKNKKNVHIHCLSIEHWKPNYQYDVLISGLPLNCFSPEQVKMFISTFKRLVKKNGIISYFEYFGLSSVKLAWLKDAKQANFEKVLKIKRAFFKNYGIKKEVVLANLPPARVLHFQNHKKLTHA